MPLRERSDSDCVLDATKLLEENKGKLLGAQPMKEGEVCDAR